MINLVFQNLILDSVQCSNVFSESPQETEWLSLKLMLSIVQNPTLPSQSSPEFRPGSAQVM